MKALANDLFNLSKTVQVEKFPHHVFQSRRYTATL